MVLPGNTHRFRHGMGKNCTGKIAQFRSVSERNFARDGAGSAREQPLNLTSMVEKPSTSGKGQGHAMAEEFQQIVRGADKLPLPTDAREPAKTETTQTPRFLNAAKHRLDRSLA